MNDDQLAFIEELGMSFDRMGAAPMVGRIYGALLISSETQLSAEDLAELLQASRGAISQGTRTLISMRLIERTRKPGVRKDFFRVRPGGWTRAVLNKQHEIDAMRDIFRHGLNAMENAPHAARATLNENIDFLNFWEQRLLDFLQEWEQHKEHLHAKRHPND